MSAFDARPWVASVLAHLNWYTQLGAMVANFSGDKASVQARGELVAFVAWLRTMCEASPVVVDMFDGSGNVHLVTSGVLMDGTRTRLSVVLGDLDSDLLAANTPVEKRATIPTELLLRLVDHVAAEAVAS